MTYEEALALQQGRIPYRFPTTHKIKQHEKLLGLSLYARPEMPDNLVVYLGVDGTPLGQTYKGVSEGNLFSAVAAVIPTSLLPEMEAGNDNQA